VNEKISDVLAHVNKCSTNPYGMVKDRRSV